MTKTFTFLFTLLLSAPAVAQEAGAEAPSIFSSLMPLILIFVIFWFLIIRPQSKKLKEHRAMVEGIDRNDVVVTAGGVVGTVVASTPDRVTLRVADGVEIEVIRSTLGDVVEKGDPKKTVAKTAAKATAEKKAPAKKPAAKKTTTKTAAKKPAAKKATTKK